MNRQKLASVGMAVALGLGLTAGAASPASAETIKRPKGSSTAVIKPAGAPKGAVSVTGKVTVKKGKKTVAKNKSSYKAKKGTYKVTSTFTYRTATNVPVAGSQVFAECRVNARSIISDRTQRNDWFDGEVYYAGQVTVRYWGACDDDVFVGTKLVHVRWATTWTDDEFLMTDILPAWANATPAKYAELYNAIGDMDYVSGSDMSKLPTVKKLSGIKKTSRTRTVTVR